MGHRDRVAELRRDLTDERGGRVVFLSHCLLNQNTRYLGGATCPGVVAGAVERYITDGVGIVQMPCPEQRVWGGVLKRRFLWLLDRPRMTRVVRFMRPLLTRYLRFRYRRLAGAVVRDVNDYVTSDVEVVGVAGVAGSPSCGVHSTLDLGRALVAMGSCPRRVTTDRLNRTVIAPATVPGRGLFIECVAERLARAGRSTAIFEEILERPGGG